MNKYRKIFGIGPFGAMISIALLLFFWMGDQLLGHPSITTNLMLLRSVGILLIFAGLGVHIWAFLTLRNWWVDNKICKSGPFKYVRHPMYSAWIILIVSGVSLCLNSWIFLIWPLSIHPIWHKLVVKEEKAMGSLFGDEYQTYAELTGRFVPKIF
jgi:protein-S-isoprenylcysteine O-methyltransferase Ste14